MLRQHSSLTAPKVKSSVLGNKDIGSKLIYRCISLLGMLLGIKATIVTPQSVEFACNLDVDLLMFMAMA